MGPAIFGVSVSQINLLLDTMLATFLPTGSVSCSIRIACPSCPWVFRGHRYRDTAQPSRHHAASSPEAYSQTLDWALRFVLLIAVPAAAALLLLAEPILATLFYYGDVMTGYHHGHFQPARLLPGADCLYAG